MPTREGKVEARPFLKWAGGKYSLIENFRILGHIPNDFSDYYEPFLGGGAMYFHLFNAGSIKKKAHLSDINEELINIYTIIRDNYELLLTELSYLKRKIDSDEYYRIRHSFNQLKRKKVPIDEDEKIMKAAYMLYLNKTCYNGLYRENKDGNFNVPFGKYKNPNIYSESNIKMASAALQKAILYVADYSSCLSAKEKDFVYLDPPYYPISDTSNFTSYDQSNFGKDEHQHLAEIIKTLDKRGVKVLVSNSKHPDVETIYGRIGFSPITVFARRYINCKGNRRESIEEYIIKNYNHENVKNKQQQTRLM